MEDNERAPAPTIPPAWCTCGKRLVWCGVREQWVDASHRSSHTGKDGSRRPHNTQGMNVIPKLEA